MCSLSCHIHPLSTRVYIVSNDSASPLRRLLDYASSHRPRIALAAVFSVLNKIFDLAPPVLIGAAVNIVVKREDSFFAKLGFADVTDQLIALAVVTVLVWALESVFEYLLEVVWRNLAQTLQHDLRVDAYTHVQQLDMNYFHEQSTGKLMSILNDDINQLERFLDQGANDLIQVLTTAIVISGMFLYFAPGVAWMAMLPVPFVLWGSFKFQDLLASRYSDVREKVGDLNGQLSNNLSGIATIKSFTTQDYERDRIRGVSESYRQANRRAISMSSAFSPLIRMFIVVGFTATLIYGGKLAISGELDVGIYSVLVFLTQRLLWPLTRLGKTFNLYQRAMASTRRVLDLLETPVTIVSGETPLDITQVEGEIEFAGVNFAYPGRSALLHDFDFRVAPGTTVGIVGATGSGKTTLINLLLRFYEAQQGAITLDGHAITELKTDDVRRAIGLVSQSVFLFHGTVHDNIAYGTPGATREQVREVARLSEALDFIEALPRGFDTLVGERGQTLSGGQRQRLSIARALLKDPPILILDEATSAVDNETEAALQRSLDILGASRTMIVIAHRLSTVRHADEIVVLHDGGIAERGTHEVLLENDGLYTRLWKVQTGAL